MRRLTDGELEKIKAVGNPKLSVLADLASKQLTCSHCGKCTRSCEVLAGPALDMGKVEAAYESLAALPAEERPAAVVEAMSEDYSLYNALRQCCFCGNCTAACARHVPAPEVMRAWRELFCECGLMPPDASKLVMVDNEWHIFSAYRAIYQVAYPNIAMIDQLAAAAQSGEDGEGVAGEGDAADAAQAQPEPTQVDTLLFPGCSLVSYAPEVIEALGAWMDSCGIKWAMSDACCGSPLMSAGLFDRADALRQRLIDQMRAVGIKRMVTICPGCADEFRADLPPDIELVPLPELLEEQIAARKQVGQPSGLNPLELSSATFFDSCHDRSDSRNASALRRLFAEHLPDCAQREMPHAKRSTLCCGAGGAVASYDPAITDRRVWRVIGEAKRTRADFLMTMCPTCTYTIAQANLQRPADAMPSLHYLEALFGVQIDWDIVFYQLNAMWSGEYGPWLNQTFF